MIDHARKVFFYACGAATAAVLAGAAALMISAPAGATPKFATATGKTCLDCHTKPKGAGTLTALGEKFKANGNKMPK